MGTFRRRVGAGRAAPIVGLPLRVGPVARRNGVLLRQSAQWLVKSRELTNFTYDLTPRNRAHLSWWIANLTGRSVSDVRRYLAEILEDAKLQTHVRNVTMASDHRGVADSDMRLGRRIGWYALVRALKPRHVIETGTDKGLGSCVLASAILRNGAGRLTTIDVNPTSGFLITNEYASVTTRIIGDSVRAIQTQISDSVDIFLHDSYHTPQHERSEFDAVYPRLSAAGLVLSDNAHASDALMEWAEEKGRTFMYFCEQPLDHWYPGDGIGAAVVRTT